MDRVPASSVFRLKSREINPRAIQANKSQLPFPLNPSEAASIYLFYLFNSAAAFFLSLGYLEPLEIRH